MTPVQQEAKRLLERHKRRYRLTGTGEQSEVAFWKRVAKRRLKKRK